MAKTSTPSLTVTVTGDAMVASTFTPTNIAANTNAAPPSFQTLSSGNNTITVPSIGTPLACLVIPPVASAVSKTYRGVSGDTGLTGTSQWVVLPLTGMSSFVINAASGETVQLIWM